MTSSEVFTPLMADFVTWLAVFTVVLSLSAHIAAAFWRVVMGDGPTTKRTITYTHPPQPPIRKPAPTRKQTAHCGYCGTDKIDLNQRSCPQCGGPIKDAVYR